MALDPESKNELEERTVKMSFLEHIDELRRRLVRSFVVVIVLFIACWAVSDRIYNFLSIPVREALSIAEQKQVELAGLSGEAQTNELQNLPLGTKARYTFDRKTRIGKAVLSPGTSVAAIRAKDEAGKEGIFSEEEIIVGDFVVPKGIRLPSILDDGKPISNSLSERMIVTTAVEPFTLYVTVSLYAAIALSIPFLLWQIWGFISPALYKHERRYVTPFIFLSTVAFVGGAAFAYYILFPPAVSYLLGVGQDFDLMLRATDYFDFIILIMLAMGIIFQMPAISYVLSRIGLISADFLIRSWKIALVVILIVAAVISPTGDIPNLLLFAAPMTALYIVSIFVAWGFGKKRRTEESA